MNYIHSMFFLKKIIPVAICVSLALFGIFPKKTEAAFGTCQAAQLLYIGEAVAKNEPAIIGESAIAVPVSPFVLNQIQTYNEGLLQLLDTRTCGLQEKTVGPVPGQPGLPGTPFASLDGILKLFVKVLIKQITQDTVNWINNGFKGGPGGKSGPAFLTDPGNFFTNVADETAGEFLLKTIGVPEFLCSPFSIDIRISLATKYVSRYEDEAKCTLTDMLGNVKGAAEDFIEGDFQQGGWRGWFHLTQSRSNNPYGSYLKAKGELDIRIAGKKLFETKKLDWGNGFFSWEECIKHDEEGNCIKYETQTPGKVVESQLNHTLGGALREYELAKSFDDIILALANQLITQVINGGKGLLQKKDTNVYDRSKILGSIDRDGWNELGVDTSTSTPDGISPETPSSGSPDGHPPAGQNLALNKPARQSSTYSPGVTGANNATDGIDIKMYEAPESYFAVTNQETQAWWEVDLGQVYQIDKVEVTARIRGLDLENFYVIVSETPLTGSLSQILARSDVKKIHFSGHIVNNPESFSINALGRYVRVQRGGNTPHYLQLSEVKVISGQPPATGSGSLFGGGSPGPTQPNP